MDNFAFERKDVRQVFFVALLPNFGIGPSFNQADIDEQMLSGLLNGALKQESDAQDSCDFAAAGGPATIGSDAVAAYDL